MSFDKAFDEHLISVTMGLKMLKWDDWVEASIHGAL
jgi:hypothetical protein